APSPRPRGAWSACSQTLQGSLRPWLLRRPTAARSQDSAYTRRTGARLGAGAAPCCRPFFPDLPFRVARQSSSKEVEESTNEVEKLKVKKSNSLTGRTTSCFSTLRLSTFDWLLGFQLSTVDLSTSTMTQFRAFVSRATTFASLRRWRSSPENVAPRKARTSSRANSVPITLLPITSTFMSSCSTP